METQECKIVTSSSTPATSGENTNGDTSTEVVSTDLGGDALSADKAGIFQNESSDNGDDQNSVVPEVVSDTKQVQ